jgi:hypothetical protein
VQPDVSNIPIRDIHLPDPVSWWPPALGWWILLLLVVLMVGLTIWIKRQRQRFRLRTTAMAELEAIYQSYQTQYDAKRFARELSVLLRRICISYFPKGDAAGLTGQAWLAYLDSLLSAKYNKSGQNFSDGVGKVLAKAPYQNKLQNHDIDVNALYELSREWIYSLGAVQPTKTSSPRLKKEPAHVSV